MYGYKKEAGLSYENAVERIKEELEKEGFGILTEIDVKETLKKKLDVDFNKYVILGACNPSFAHKALSVELEVGLLFPCNVIVYEAEGKTFVSAILPTSAMKIANNEELREVAKEVEIKLKRVVDAV